jgi:CDP-diacylglycerol--glycerol-3-phosphate 3-phosphatidyltransferase
MKALPNILTGIRLVLSVVVFLALAMAARAFPGQGPVMPDLASNLLVIAFVSFVVAAVTDFFDGWLARRYDAVTTTGAILDPIGDKILVCGALLGLLALGAHEVALPAGLILFREFAVSAMREVLAPRGIKLPVTFLAKTKTTLQLVALAAILGMPIVMALLIRGGEIKDIEMVRNLMLGAIGLLWLATVVTVWTGVEYAVSSAKALKASRKS